MIGDPVQRGRALAEFCLEVAPRLFGELTDAEVVRAEPEARDRARAEWEALALHACVHGLVAASGFGPGTAAAIDALQRRVLEEWAPAGGGSGAARARREALAGRLAEYAAMDRAARGGRDTGSDVRLAEAAAERMCALAPVPRGLVELIARLHRELADPAAEVVRCAE